MNSYTHTSTSAMVSEVDSATRTTFLKKTFLHLAGSILLFLGLSLLIVKTVIGSIVVSIMFGGTIQILITMALFVGASFLAQSWSRNATSKPLQYTGLILYIGLEALIFTPLLLLAEAVAGFQLVGYAGLITLMLAGSLILFTLINKVDFTFLNGFMFVAGIIIIGIVFGAIIFGLNLGVWFSALMVGFASIAILKDTSDIQRHYRPDQYIAACLSLFASIALLFYYILRIILSFTSQD
jgi:FtsH-binding integral membrane protein